MSSVTSRALVPTLLLAASLSSGCVIAVGDGVRAGERYPQERTERYNRERIAVLPLNTPLAEARAELGQPDFTEAFRSQNGEYRILRYRTHRVRADGKTTVDETTPLVFLDGRLVGIGETALVEALNQR